MKTDSEDRTDAVSCWADQIMAMIREDMRQPFPWGKQIPRDVASFSELHSYLDANTYALTVVPFDGPACICNRTLASPGCSCAYADAWDSYMELLNAVENVVSRRLAAGELREEGRQS